MTIRKRLYISNILMLVIPAVISVLALAAGVNPNTMQRAMTELEREGLVFPQRTAGRFVTEDAELIAQARQTMAREQTEEFLSAMRSLGYAPGEISELIEALVKEDGNAQL